ncbi:MAG: cobyrinate a,c-diamide synthase [Nitrospiraceae bacterium]|nr:MAG: cobyrinate a,c-diamide synthase [Nitrospiraceae bacterium]
MKGIIIAGTHSGCGKTTVTLGILAALKKKGLIVQSFKTGPDFIDAGLHRLITGRPSRNLDLWMCGEDYIRECFEKYSADADISVVEGVMGLYDGKLSTASLANALDLPVILVVDAYGMAESAGAVVRGFRGQGSGVSVKPTPYTLFPTPCFAGVIFNRVASENHFNRLKDSVHDMPVLGYLPRDLDFEIPHRHLGLTTAEERPISEEAIQKLADVVLKYIDVEGILQNIEQGAKSKDKQVLGSWFSVLGSKVKIAVAHDKAFCFYYEDNLDLLREAGAEVITFSPLSDKMIPDDIDALYIGGGYPELYAKELSANKAMLDSIRNFADNNMPVYAECGGFMYLTNGIWKREAGKWEMWEMAGIFPFETQMKDKLSRLGYREVHLKEDGIFGKKDSVIRGHEFHYSEIKDSSKLQATSNKLINFNLLQIYSVKDSYGNNLRNEGYKIKNTFGSYIHAHFGSDKAMAENFVNYCKGASWK